MSSIQERLQLKRVPLDTWNIREQLCLASAVVRSGDQNWMSVSRALKTVGEPNRPPDWYSQKSCAAQYGALLEHVETPKRKKRCSEGAVETPQESILKRLTQERIVEIQKTVAEMHQQYDQLKTEITEVRNQATSEERLRELWTAVETAKRARERECARRAAWLKEREEKRARADRTWRPPQPTTPTSQAPGLPGVPTTPTPAPPSSPLLTSLLKSSPVVTTPQHISHPANSIETVSPSATAPTLSMLLEKPAPVTSTTSGSSSSGSQHESKHAAIEHIKSQLVQIEQQLIASTCASPVPLAPVPAVDIDDIEIKAEDVYAFRDIDIHIPPVTAMHKPNTRVLEKPSFKKEEVELITPMDTDETINVEVVKEEPIPVEAISEEIIPTPIVQAIEPPPLAPDQEVRMSFPDALVRFPTTEIKVINQQETRVKDEVKEPEVVLPEPEKKAEEEVVEEEPHVEVVEESISSPPAEETPLPAAPSAPLEAPPAPEHIPLPPGPEPGPPTVEDLPEIPMPPEPETPLTEESQEETEEVEIEQDTEQPAAEEHAVDVKKEIIHDEDSMPLKDIIKEESLTEAAAEGVAEVVEGVPADAGGVPEAFEGVTGAVEGVPEGAEGVEGVPGGPEGGAEVKLEPEDAHTETDDDTPMELSREEEKDGKKKRDYSRKKKSDSRTYSGSESAAEASAPESPSASDAERQHRLWKKSVMLVYSRLCAHKYASLFLRPITDEEAPGYSLVIKRPMDLTAIRRNIDNGNIRTTAEFQRDVLLMLSNALMYNSSEHSVYTMAKEMHEEAACQLGMLLAAQAHAGLSAPLARRKRRRRDAPAPPNTANNAPRH